MPTSMRIVPRGLVTDPSRLVAGDGGLVDAQNVVFRSEGLIEPRAALSFVGNEAVYGLAGFGIDTVPLHSREWDSDTVTAFGSTDDDYLISIARETDAFPLITMGGEYNTAEVRVFSELADGRCIWTLPNSLRCLDQSDQTIDESNFGGGAFIRLPGAPRACVYSGTLVAGGFLGVAEGTAYRVTIVRWIETENGTRVPVEGPPSDRYVLINSLAGTALVNLRIFCGTQVRVGDVIRVYRTPTNSTGSADPGDEMILRYSHTVTEDFLGGIPASSSLFIDFVDSADADEFDGPSLYTNLSQQGGTRANYRLRTARDLALYQGKLFYGGGDAGWRQSTTLKHVGDVDSMTDKTETLLSVRTASATSDWTTASAVITGVPASTFPYLSVGQLVTSGATPVDSGSLYGFITEFNSAGSTITLDREQPDTVSNANVYVWDWVAWTDENETSYRVYAPYKIIGTAPMISPYTDQTIISMGAGDGIMGIQTGGASILHGAIEQAFWAEYPPFWSTVDLASNEVAPYARMYSQTGTDPNIGITITIEYDNDFGNVADMTAFDGSSFFALPRIAITSSKPAAFTTPVGRTYAESIPANRDSVATLWWSKINQPESVPLGNFAIVGDASQPISRIFATIDRLWILKPDGLYCAYGSGDTEDSITIQLVDGTFRMIDTADEAANTARCSTWAAKCRDTVFAWSRNGIMAIGSGGVSRIDSAIETDVRSFTPSYNITQVEQTLGRPFCSASEREAIVVFGSSGTGGEAPIPGCCYVYHVETGAWATWTAMPLMMSGEGATSDFLVPTHCGGYGASVSGQLRVPSYFGYISYLDVPSNNTARLASTALADDVYPVTGDRMNISQYWANTITNVANNVVTWDDLGPATIPGARWKDAAGDWFWTLSTSYGIETISVVSGTPVVGALQDCHYAVDRVITFAANQPPFTEKHFLSCWAHFQNIRAGTQFTTQWRARGHVAGEAPTLTVVYDLPGGANYLEQRLDNDLEYDKAISIPTETSRARGVEMTLTDAQSDVYFAMDGLTMQYEAETVRIEGRR